MVCVSKEILYTKKVLNKKTSEDKNYSPREYQHEKDLPSVRKHAKKRTIVVCVSKKIPTGTTKKILTKKNTKKH